MQTADYWIKQLHLEPHPEGGFFRESYRSQGTIPASGLAGFVGSRNFSTAIYYLLRGEDFSSFHKLKSDEVWHFYDGCPLKILLIQNSGTIITKVLGTHIEAGESLQQVIPSDLWFAAHPVDAQSFALAGCTMSPGFDMKDFELGTYETLSNLYPQHAELIRLYTRA